MMPPSPCGVTRPALLACGRHRVTGPAKALKGEAESTRERLRLEIVLLIARGHAWPGVRLLPQITEVEHKVVSKSGAHNL